MAGRSRRDRCETTYEDLKLDHEHDRRGRALGCETTYEDLKRGFGVSELRDALPL